MRNLKTKKEAVGAALWEAAGEEPGDARLALRGTAVHSRRMSAVVRSTGLGPDSSRPQAASAPPKTP